jgi:hypothetical protein
VGTVTQIIPPNYGVVDGDAFYIEQLVVPGSRVPKVGGQCKADTRQAGVVLVWVLGIGAWCLEQRLTG